MASTKEIFRLGKDARREPGGFNEALQRFPKPGIVIDNRYDWFCQIGHEESGPFVHNPIVGGRLPRRYYVFI
jgi:hypothetical protein